MRMQALSKESGVSVPTIKYYIREGLMPPGTPTGPNQADYGDTHLRRLALIRALREVGGLGIATIREVLASAGETQADTIGAMGQAMDALAASARPDEAGEHDPRVPPMVEELRKILASEGWVFRPGAGALSALARALVAGADAMGEEPAPKAVRLYAEPVMEIARREFGPRQIQEDEARVDEDTIAWAVVGTILYEPVILALRRLAHEHEALSRLPEHVRRKLSQ